MNPSLRDALASDADADADLHAASWRAAYRSILPDAFLDGPAGPDLRRHWRAVLAGLEAPALVALAEADRDGPLGFAAAWPDPEDRPGFLVDNLHVRPDLRGAGIGRLLLGAAARRIALGGGGRCVHLWVLDGNRAAARFYARLGAQVADRGVGRIAGTDVSRALLAWPDARSLAEACG